MRYIGIDPGTTESAYVVYDPDSKEQILESGLVENNKMLVLLDTWRHVNVNADNKYHLAIEMIASYGMAVGETTFETCLWIGRFIQVFGAHQTTKVYRARDGDVPGVKMYLCHSNKAKDSNIRQAIIDKFGGEDIAIGGKKCHECKGRGTLSGKIVCPECPGKCEKCKGRGTFKRNACPDCLGRLCSVCGNKGKLDKKPPCLKCNETGWKYAPGPLKEISSHRWQALAAAITYAENTTE